ncbi:hypothetical protein PoB_004016400 [Plakobranchus ocellatus]|uniref:Uncharacterized protein n=1 Tax=Plakobranchus ocellatus TaxID=259542 RepID=A0AAV4B4P9_9GAST|nr:hypothetical protein PoB_004016400 [Plakobranchus ocellatus]
MPPVTHRLSAGQAEVIGRLTLKSPDVTAVTPVRRPAIFGGSSLKTFTFTRKGGDEIVPGVAAHFLNPINPRDYAGAIYDCAAAINTTELSVSPGLIPRPWKSRVGAARSHNLAEGPLAHQAVHWSRESRLGSQQLGKRFFCRSLHRHQSVQ